MNKDSQIKSKQRVSDHAEVFTSEREVNAMLDLVKQETERIDSRFLEPACGDGNFLSEILNRKLKIVEGRYKKSQNELDKYSLVAIASIYGVELLVDNVERCRERLFEIYLNWYNSVSRGQTHEKLFDCVQFVLSKNIVHGDALTLKTVEGNEEPIIFSEWSFTQNMLKRRCFAFDDLLKNEAIKETPLFSDLGDDVILPRTIEEFPLVHYLELADNV
jgi:hypothetical protein